jgi:hypothetical protein
MSTVTCSSRTSSEPAAPSDALPRVLARGTARCGSAYSRGRGRCVALARDGLERRQPLPSAVVDGSLLSRLRHDPRIVAASARSASRGYEDALWGVARDVAHRPGDGPRRRVVDFTSRVAGGRRRPRPS